MTAAESKGLKKGNRAYWRGDSTDSGIITEMSWDAVTIAWDNGHVATVHRGDMREIQRTPAKPTIKAYYRYIVSSRNVCSWPKADIPTVAAFVYF